MRRLPLLLAFSSIVVFAASPKLVITSQYADGRDHVVQVRNESETPVTAFAVGTSETGITSTDILLGAHEGRPLRMGDTAEVRIPNGAGEAQVLATVFADGSTQGEAALLLGKRQEVAEQIRFALTLLHNENVSRFSASAVSGWFRTWRERWQASDPNRQMPVAVAAETYFKQAGSEMAARPARELTEAFEELFTKLTGTQPSL